MRPQVIDEADRLLAQSFQGWLSTVLAATTQSNAPPIPSKDSNLPRADAAAEDACTGGSPAARARSDVASRVQGGDGQAGPADAREPRDVRAPGGGRPRARDGCAEAADLAAIVLIGHMYLLRWWAVCMCR